MNKTEKITIRVSPDLKQKAIILAENNNRILSEYMRLLLQIAVESKINV